MSHPRCKSCGCEIAPISKFRELICFACWRMHDNAWKASSAALARMLGQDPRETVRVQALQTSSQAS